MNTLLNAPVHQVLNRLFAESEQASPMQIPALARLSKAEQTAMMQSKSEYRELYAQLKDVPLAVSKDTANLLYMLARSCNARCILEFGTSYGISTLHLAAALRDNGGGRLLTTEFEASKVRKATQHLSQANLLDLVEIREGDALQSLSSNLPAQIDLLLLDGAKALYLDVLHLVQPNLRAGALIVADNADYCAEYMAYIANPANGYLSVPFAKDVELSCKLV